MNADSLSPFIQFSRDEWSALKQSTPLLLTDEDLNGIRGLNERLSLVEVADIYLPLSRLLNLHVIASQNLERVTHLFLGTPAARVPYIIGIAGSVAVGKSTTARIIQKLLQHWPDHPRVDLVTTDGFLFPNHVLESRGILNRKGFPESYDVRALIEFLSAVKSGRPEVAAPVYSHLYYDIIPGKFQIVQQPDILIVEGLNVLQTPPRGGGIRGSRVFVSDFFDFSVYIDAEVEDIQKWYVERFLVLRETAFRNEESYFHRFSELNEQEAIETASSIWRQINEVNLLQNILPTKDRARLILQKGPHHEVERVRLRKI